MTNFEISGKLIFHVRKEIKPQSIVLILIAISADEDAGSVAFGGLGTRAQAIAELRRVGLIAPRTNELTEQGSLLIELNAKRPHLVAEALHAMYIRLAVESVDGSKFGAGWAYRQVCAFVWGGGGGILDRTGIIGRFYASASAEFGLPEDQIAFSTTSINGITNWLGGLEPQVYAESVITLRHVCPPEAVWWAVDGLHYVGGQRMPTGIRLPLTADLSVVLCQQLLIHEDALGRVLDQAKRRSDFNQGGIFDTGTAGGQGRWVLLARRIAPPQILDR